MKKKKKWLVAAASLAAVAALVGTFAWFTSTDKAVNKFEGGIAGNDVEIVETFTPPTTWEPNMEVKKAVSILNSGDYKSLIRVSLAEEIAKLTDAESHLGSDPTILNGKTEGQLYLYPLKEGQPPVGFTESTMASPKTFTVTGGDYAGTYTLKASEKAETTPAGTTYQYVSYWERAASGANPAKKYYAKVGSYSRDAQNKLTPAKAEFKYVSLALATPVEFDWTKNNRTGDVISSGNPYQAIKATLSSGTTLPAGTLVFEAGSDKNVEIKFVNITETPTENMWYYNKGDGWFYFFKVVPAQTQTAQLIDTVKLSSRADNSYSKFKFDLTVNAKSIQAHKEAVNSTDWLNGKGDSGVQQVMEGLTGLS